MLVYIVVKLVLLTRVGVTIVTPIAQALFGKDVERIKIRAIVVTILCVESVLVDKNFYLVDMVGERVGEGITTRELDHSTALLLSTPPTEVAVDKHHLAEDGAIREVFREVIGIGFVHIGDGVPIFLGIFLKRFVRLFGRLNCQLAAEAALAAEVTAGVPVILKKERETGCLNL